MQQIQKDICLKLQYTTAYMRVYACVCMYTKNKYFDLQFVSLTVGIGNYRPMVYVCLIPDWRNEFWVVIYFSYDSSVSD